MIAKNKLYVFLSIGIFQFFISCTKQKQITVNGNKIPIYTEIPTIMVENYVNRTFIDLLGREATNTERDYYTTYLKNNKLDTISRGLMIRTLIYDETYRAGDSSYKHAWTQRIYDLSKARFIDGAGDGDILADFGNIGFSIKIARLNGDSITVHNLLEEQNLLGRLYYSKYRFRKGFITFNEMCAYMLNNTLYDKINMNSFNFVNASFDDVFNRTPSAVELKQGLAIIDKNEPTLFLGKTASNKGDYCDLMTNNSEFYEAQIHWVFYNLLRRQATPSEVAFIYPTYRNSKKIQDIQYYIIKGDEYAQFN